MRTWIFRVEEEKAQVFYLDEKESVPRLHSTISRAQVRARVRGARRFRPDFLKYVAEEMNIACGSGTHASLVICAATDLAKDLLRYLNPGVAARMEPAWAI